MLILRELNPPLISFTQDISILISFCLPPSPHQRAHSPDGGGCDRHHLYAQVASSRENRSGRHGWIRPRVLQSWK